MDKVVLINNTNGKLVLCSEQTRFSHVFPSKGAKFAIDKSLLEEMMWEEGVRYVIDSGMLYIEDLKAKQELGIEPEDVTEPVNIIILTDNERKRWLTVLPDNEFKEKVSKLGREEIINLADYAIKNEILSSFEKTEIIKKACGKDVISAIKLNRQEKED